MSVAYYIVLEREIAGFDPFVNGKAYAHADEKKLKKLVQDLKVRPLEEFVSQDPEELADFLEDEGVDVPDNLPPETWFQPAEGLITVRALIEALTMNPKILKDSASVVEDLREYEGVLLRLQKENVRWHLALDF